MNIPERVEEIRGALARGYCSKENEQKVLDADLIEAMVIEVQKLLTETDQQAREEGYAQGLKEGQNATAVEVIKGYNAEKLQLIEALKRTGNKEFYIQGDISRRLKEVDANLSVLSNPPSQV